MKIARKKLSQRIFNATMAFCLVLSSVSASVPFILSQKASAVTATVCATGCTHTSIQSAIDNASTGDIITVDPGTYIGNITITTSDLTLRGANAGTDGNATRTDESIIDGSITITADNVTIDGFTVNGPSGSSAIVMQGSNSGIMITNNIINNNGYAVNFNTSNTTISHNKVNYVGTSIKSGVEANSDPGNYLTFEYNTFTGNGNPDTADITVIGTASPRTTNVRVTNNTSTSGTTLVALFNTQNAVITGNHYTGNNTSSALYIGGSNINVSVTNNTIAKASTALNIANDFGWGSNVSVSAHNNRFESTNTKGVKVSLGAYNGSYVDATNNWWGTATGPNDVVSGDGSIKDTNSSTGSTAIGAVKYTGWCVTTLCTIYSDNTLAAPTNLTPSTGMVTNDINFTNSWTKVEGAIGYEYQTSNTSNGTTLGSIIHDDSSAEQPSRYNLTGSTIYRTNSGTPEGDYYWQVRTVNAEGVAGPWSAINKVTVDKTPPAAPVLSNSPITINSSMPNAQAIWTHSGVDVDHYEYREYLSLAEANADSNGNTASYWIIEHPANEKTQTVGQAWTGEHTLYYRVVAVDAAGNRSAPSALGTITIDKVPAAVTLTSPSDNAVVKGASVTQAWSTSSNDVHHYIYESYNDAGATSLRWHETFTTTSKTATNVGNASYWWRVKAVDNAGNEGIWSTLRKLTVDSTAPVVEITSPTVNLTNGNVEVRATVSDANLRHYWFQIKKDGVVINSQTVLSSGITNQLLQTLTENGVYTITVAARDLAGGTADSGNRSTDIVKTVTIDKVLTLSVNSVDTSSATTRTISGVTDPQAEVTVTVHSTPQTKVTTAGADGSWSVIFDDLEVGTHSVTVKSKDTAGNEKTADVVPFEVTQTFTAPQGTSTQQLPSNQPASQNQLGLVAFNTYGTTDDTAVLGAQTQNTPANDDKNDAGDDAKDILGATATPSQNKDGTWSYAGLNWYWWLPIVLAIGGAAWWSIAAYRRRQEQES